MGKRHFIFLLAVTVFLLSACNKSQISSNIKGAGGCNHNWIDATCTTTKYCSICNTTEGTELGHDWQNATCTAPKKCSRCKVSEGKKLGHTKNEICTRCGYIDKKLAVKNAKKSIYVYGIDLEMNSVGGVDTYITWKNVSHKEIKYISFYVQYYNRVKDVIKDEIRDETTIQLSSTGPFPYGKGNYFEYSSCDDDSAETLYFTVSSGYENDIENGWAGKYWEAPFYNTTTKFVKIKEVEIEYMDGSTYVISESDAVSAIVGSGRHTNAWDLEDMQDDYLR